jgi:DNA mismatch repair ATPase MutL
VESGENIYDFMELIGPASDAEPDIEVYPDDICRLQYTGGTTGVPKGCVLTNAMMYSQCIRTSVWVTSNFKLIPFEEVRTLCAIPLNHIYGLNANVNICLYTGGTLVLVAQPTPDNLLAAIEQHRPNLFAAVPAIDVAYQGLLLSREYPIVILNISVPGNLVDVNVHPQKWEVRFADEKQVFSLIRQVIVDHLSRHDRLALAGIHQVSYPPPLSRPSYNQVDYETGELLLNETNGASLDYREPLPTFSVDNRPGFSSEARVLGQLMKSYILVEIEEGLWIIDQHAAHERILFNRLKQENQQAITGHDLLFPVSLEISTRQVELLEREKERMEQIGFSYDRAGLSSVIIRRAPSQIKGQEPQVLMDLIELLDNGNYKDFREEAMISMACNKAIKAGDFMSASEMQILINDLLVQEQYQHCPHGRPTLMKIGHHDLEKVFKRA